MDGSQSTIEVNRAAVESLEREAEGLSDAGDLQALARLECLESARGASLAEMRDLEAAQNELPRLTEAIVSATVFPESETLESRALVPVVVLALCSAPLSSGGGPRPDGSP